MTSKPAAGGPSSTSCHSLGENASLVVMALSDTDRDACRSRKSISRLAPTHLTRNGSYAVVRIADTSEHRNGPESSVGSGPSQCPETPDVGAQLGVEKFGVGAAFLAQNRTDLRDRIGAPRPQPQQDRHADGQPDQG